MQSELSELSSSDRKRLGDIIASFLGAGTDADRTRIKDAHPGFAGMLDSVFAGLDAWNALSLHSQASEAPTHDSMPEPVLNGHAPRPEPNVDTLQRDDLIVPVLDSRLSRGFQVVECVGRGGAGVVYRARLPNEVHGQPDIAIKLLRDGVSLDVSKRLRDAQVLKGLDHPNLVRVYWAGRSVGHGPFVATEFVEGCNLRDWLYTHGAMSAQQAGQVVCVLAGAMEAAHGKQVIHCDIKPDNVFGCQGERPDPELLKIGDFGLARYLPSGADTTGKFPGIATGGTIGYMAPEQYWGDYDAGSDIYAIGALMLCLISARKGERAHFLESDQVAKLRALRSRSSELLPPGPQRERVRATFRDCGLLCAAERIADGPLRAILTKCLAFDPKDRYQSAGALREDVQRWLEDREVVQADYAYGPQERFSMLIRRCRDRDDVQDHSTLWGLVCLVTGPCAIILSTLGTALDLLGQNATLSRHWTATLYVAIWLAILIPTLKITRFRRPTSQLFGYMLILMVSHAVLRYGMGFDNGRADAAQYLVLGVLFGCMGLGSRHWLLFLYLGLCMIVLSSLVAMVARQPWFDPYGPALLGLSQGVVLVAFGISYLSPAAQTRPNRSGK